jgi:hypothetical protein
VSALADALAEAGGVRAPPDRAAWLREALSAELRRGEAELRQARSGYGDPVCVAFAPAGEVESAQAQTGRAHGDGARVLAACPLPAAARADTGAAPARAWLVAAAAIGALVAVAGGGPPRGSADLALGAGRLGDHLALAFPLGERRDEPEAAELAALAFDEEVAGIDRLRARGVAAPAGALAGVDDLRAPIGATHPFRVAETVARLGGRPAHDDSLDTHEDAVLALLEPAPESTPAHRDPDPARRVARRIVQRLDGMGKWGGYHTDFTHLARGFAGNDKALALAVGERLLAAGLLLEKPSVGQRHVFLNPRRSGEIRALIEHGTVPQELELPPR